MRLAIVSVRRDETHTQHLNVPPWEIEIMKAVHGSAAITVLGETFADRELSTPEEEYDRLVRRYGIDADTETPYVSQVYGLYAAGIRALGQEMRATQEGVEDELPPRYDIEPLLIGPADDAVREIKQLADVDALVRILDPETGDPRKTVLAAAQKRLDELGGPQAAQRVQAPATPPIAILKHITDRNQLLAMSEDPGLGGAFRDAVHDRIAELDEAGAA